MIARNILANALGGSWFALLSLAIIPIQIRFLGIDAYGLLAFTASLQIAFSIFDLGLTPTISRELATDSSPDLRNTLDLVQSVAGGYVAIGVLLGGGLALGAGWLVAHWLNLGDLPADSARTALQFGGLAIMLRWPVSFLSGMLVGRGRFATLNVLKAAAATIGLVGGALIIIAFADLVIFTAWMALAALIEVTLYVGACYRVVPNLSFRPKLSRRALENVWRFVVGVSVIGALGTLLAQSDRLLLSTLAPIETLGYYSLAYSILMGITLVQTFFTSALLPSFAASHESGATERLAVDYNRATQSLVYLCVLPVALLAFFAQPLLALLTTAETAAASAQILVILAPAFLLNAAVSIPYILALATGHTRMIVLVYFSAAIFYLPLLYVAITRWGGVGAAAAWLVLNISYLFTLVPIVQRGILNQNPISWIGRNLLPFLVVGVLSFGLVRAILELAGWHETAVTIIGAAAAAIIYGICGFLLLDSGIRRSMVAMAEQSGLLRGDRLPFSGSGRERR